MCLTPRSCEQEMILKFVCSFLSMWQSIRLVFVLDVKNCDFDQFQNKQKQCSKIKARSVCDKSNKITSCFNFYC